jgi:hypothetical protein
LNLVLLATVGKPVNWNRYISKNTPEVIYRFTDFSSVIDDRPRKRGASSVGGEGEELMWMEVN